MEIIGGAKEAWLVGGVNGRGHRMVGGVGRRGLTNEN